MMLMMDEVRRPHDREGRDPAGRPDRDHAAPLHAKAPEEFRLFAPNDDLVPDMANAGDGYKFHVTGLTHDERGYPSMTSRRRTSWCAACRTNSSRSPTAARCSRTEDLDDADVVVVSYGITSRVAQRAIRNGARAGHSKPASSASSTAWPFPEQHIRELAGQREGFRGARTESGADGARSGARRARGQAKTSRVPHAGGSVHTPEEILKAIRGGQPMSDCSTDPVDATNPVEPFLRMDRMPHIWCPGCGIGTTVNCFARALMSPRST